MFEDKQADDRYQLDQCVDEIKRLQAQVAALEAECAPFRPMSIEEAEAALDALDEADCPKMSEEQIEHGVKYATDDAYRANWLKEKFDEQCRINRGLRTEVKRLTDFYNEVGAAIANEGPHTLEHLMATAMLGKHTTVIGVARYKQFRRMEEEVARLNGLIRNVIAGKWCVTDLQEAIGDLIES